MLNNYYHFVSQYNIDAIANYLMELIGYPQENPDYLLLHAYIFDEAASVFMSDMAEEEKGNYILRNAYDWYDRYLIDYKDFIDELTDPFLVDNSQNLALNNQAYILPLIEMALLVLDVNSKDSDYDCAKDFLKYRFTQEYPTPGDVDKGTTREFRGIIQETIQYLSYLEKIQRSLDSFEGFISKIVDIRASDDTPNT